MATWTISTMERNTSDGGVIVAHWRVNDSETVGEDTFFASDETLQRFLAVSCIFKCFPTVPLILPILV